MVLLTFKQCTYCHLTIATYLLLKWHSELCPRSGVAALVVTNAYADRPNDIFQRRVCLNLTLDMVSIAPADNQSSNIFASRSEPTHNSV